jgi:hypothetical protein
MFALFSYIEFEGKTFHGIFENNELARKARELMIYNQYNADKFIIQKLHINTVMFDNQQETIY